MVGSIWVFIVKLKTRRPQDGWWRVDGAAILENRPQKVSERHDIMNVNSKIAVSSYFLLHTPTLQRESTSVSSGGN